jgi:uncharacterized protein
MKIVYDENKRRLNLEKHGFDFVTLDMGFFQSALIVETKLNRMKAIGLFNGGKISVVFFRLGSEGISIISMRAASRMERKLYDQC